MKRKYIFGIIIAIIIALIAVSGIFLFSQGTEEDVCPQCHMLNCHDHATSGYCCDMCSMEDNSKCNCPMPTENTNSSNSSSNGSSKPNNDMDMNT
jgi:hypothetical protein